MTKEEKDKLIELSDLNMKDNIKYISSEAQGIAITLDSDRLAPSMCKLERAYICGRRKSEEQIAELEKACEETQELLDKQIEATYKLDKENAELKKDKKELCHSISEGGKACVYLNEHLTKATEIIKKLYAVYYDPCVTESDLKYRDELFAEIKQFLSEVEK